MKFRLKAAYQPAGDQPNAIRLLTQGYRQRMKDQLLLGVTGSGKTYTIAQVIAKIQKPTLIISHNKTLAAQLYSEFREYFPHNSVNYFVSYYDYYQPEAYLPTSDTYIPKETDINQEIDQFRHQTTSNLLTKKDCIVVASVSCIYNLGSPTDYASHTLHIHQNQSLPQDKLINQLISLQYTRNDLAPNRGEFSLKGEVVDIYPATGNNLIRLLYDGQTVHSIETMSSPFQLESAAKVSETTIFAAKHYLADLEHKKVFQEIESDLQTQYDKFINSGKLVEAQRLKTRVEHDLETIKELGYVNGIENYSRYFDGRRPGEPPHTLLNYFGPDFLTVIDESHITLPQIKGMHRGDRARKEILIKYGFRLPSARDNRPLTYTEFAAAKHQTIYTTATPSKWEITLSRRAAKQINHPPHSGIVEQIIRPTGLLDPKVEIRPSTNQLKDVIQESVKVINLNQRVLITTLTKQMSEAIAELLSDTNKLKSHLANIDTSKLKPAFIHADIDTLERTEILNRLRSGKINILIGINLLREGLDLPEVSLVAILDADREGFLRSSSSLIQTMGRAARHNAGRVILYADKLTGSITSATQEVARRRQIQLAYNRQHQLVPQSISKPLRKPLIAQRLKKSKAATKQFHSLKLRQDEYDLLKLDPNQLTPAQAKRYKKNLKTLMAQAAANLDFELAAYARDLISKISK